MNRQNLYHLGWSYKHSSITTTSYIKWALIIDVSAAATTEVRILVTTTTIKTIVVMRCS